MNTGCKCIVCPTRRLASTERSHAQLNLNDGGFIFLRSLKPYCDFRKGRYCIIITIPTRRRLCTRYTDRGLYLPHVCLCSRPLIFQNIHTRSPSVQLDCHTSVANCGRLWFDPTVNSWKIKCMVNFIKRFSIS